MCFQDVTPLQIVYPDTALRLQALLDFEDDNGVKRVAGDEWLFEGPGWSRPPVRTTGGSVDPEPVRTRSSEAEIFPKSE